MEPNIKTGLIFGAKCASWLLDISFCDCLGTYEDSYLLRVHMHRNMKRVFTKKIVALALHYCVIYCVFVLQAKLCIAYLF